MSNEAIVLGANEPVEGEVHNMGRQIATYLGRCGWDVKAHDCDFAENPALDHRYAVPTWNGWYAPADGMVVTLGRTMVQPFMEASDDDLTDVVRACLVLPMLAARQYLRQRGHLGGRVVFIGSYAHDHPITNGAAYCAAKAGLDALARSLAWDYSDRGFSFFTVHPYHVPGTPMWEYVQHRVCETRGWSRQEADEYAMQNLKQPKPLTPHEVAEVVELLLSEPVAAWLSGAGLAMYGGTR